MTDTSTELELARNADLVPQADWDMDRYIEVGRRVEQYRAATAWILGDLACGVETHYGAGELVRYANAIGVEYETLKAYRTAARAWEPGIRIPDLPWTVHQVLASQPDRAELISRPEG